MPPHPANRLASASSPYLLQHARNPVDWWEWGEEALAEARRLDRPILLSVGYSACHWCHVMAHESFEDPEIAQMMNRLFVSIKVDREERPDIDRIYMDAVQAATGRGGWPMTVFLTPAGEPFYAGTYFPKHDRGGMPSFQRVMEAIADAWYHGRDEIAGRAGRLTEEVNRTMPPSTETPGQEALETAYRALVASYDPVHGGFGGAPKFPQAPTLEFLLRIAGKSWAPEATGMLEHTLSSMAAGGIYDHLGGGFARYSVDDHWLVPHFEKMLYDNALLARLYVRAWQVTGNSRFEMVARETLGYMLADLQLPEGGFASAEDADSEGEEGRFYVFTHQEVAETAREHAPLAAAVYGVTEGGNFEGSNVLHLAMPVEQAAEEFGLTRQEAAKSLAAAGKRLLTKRSSRVRPALDDKVVCAWNGLAIRAFAEAGAVLGEQAYLDAATGAAQFILDNLRTGDGRLLRSWRRGTASIPAFADDYASTAVALFALYQATGDSDWYLKAEELTHQMLDLFWDDTGGGVFATGHDAERLIARPKNLYDNPTPSDNSLAAEALSALAAATGDSSILDRIEAIARLAGVLVERAPTATGHLLAVLASARDRQELAIVGNADDPRTEALLAVTVDRFRPEVFVAVGHPGDPDPAIPLLRDRPAGHDGAPRAYLCRGFVCDAPVEAPEALRSLLA